jgi:hypothetical protein
MQVLQTQSAFTKSEQEYLYQLSKLNGLINAKELELQNQKDLFEENKDRIEKKHGAEMNQMQNDLQKRIKDLETDLAVSTEERLRFKKDLEQTAERLV